MRGITKQVAMTVMLLLIGLFVGVIATGNWQAMMTKPPDEPPPLVIVCHSPTEDSAMTDCRFHHGGWFPRHADAEVPPSK